VRLRTVIVAATVASLLCGLVVTSSTGAAALDPDQLRPPVAPSPRLAHVLTSTGHLVTVDVTNTKTILADRVVTGVSSDETIVGIDVRPATGVLYAVTLDSLDVGRIYTLDTTTGTATKGPSIKNATLTGASFGVDFNPSADRLRVIGDDDQNLRVNVDDGTAVVDTAESYATGDTNAGTNPTVTGAGYMNPFAGARTTALYVIDSALDVLALQEPANGGTLSTVGPLGIDVSSSNGFDIATSDTGWFISSGTLTGSGDGGGPNLFTVNLGTGSTTLAGTLPPLTGSIQGLALTEPGYRIAGAGPVIALAADGKSLLQVDGPANALVSAAVPITGLATGDFIVGIDFRPANGQLYGLGRLSNLYVIDVSSGVAGLINKTGTFSPALQGTSWGFDFNPVADRIRVTSNTAQNLRLDPNIGVVTSEDTPEAYKAGDANSGPGTIAGAAYTNNVAGGANAHAAAGTTALFVIDNAKSVLALQDPPNAGQLTTVGPLGFQVGTSDVGFDIVPGTNRALATIERQSATVPNPTDGLYTIDLSTGAARLVGRLPVDVVDLAIPGDGLTGRGYHLAASDGGVFSYGSARFAGSAGNLTLAAPVVGIAERPIGAGYWLVASDGGIFAYGTAGFFGSRGGQALNAPIVGIVPHPSGDGYWLFASDGGIFSFGLARFFGSAGALPLQRPIVGMAATPTGEGYWLFASDGGVFAYGDAVFFGSAGATRLNQPVVHGAAAPSGLGYYLVASDGGVFNYGPGTSFKGSTGAIKLNSPIVGISADPDGSGYVMAAKDGGVFTFDAVFAGSAGGAKLVKPIVGISGR
jgi:hypothetical protein